MESQCTPILDDFYIDYRCLPYEYRSFVIWATGIKKNTLRISLTKYELTVLCSLRLQLNSKFEQMQDLSWHE
jgi:hypothetical protein